MFGVETDEIRWGAAPSGSAVVLSSKIATVAVAGATVWIDVASDRPIEPKFATLLETMAAIVLVQTRGAIAFHGASVDGERGTVVLLAPSHGGKSTAAAMLCRAGYVLRSDDVSVVHPARAVVFGGAPLIALRADSARVLAPEVELDMGGKATIATRTPSEEWPFAAFVSLEWGEPALVPVGLVERWPLLSGARSWLSAAPDGVALLDALALPTFTLRRPRDVSQVDLVADLLEPVLGEPLNPRGGSTP